MNPRRQILRHQRQRIRRHTTSCDAPAFFNLLAAPQFLQRVESILPAHRDRRFPPTETPSMFLAQALSADRSCQNAVDELSIKRACGGFRKTGTDLFSRIRNALQRRQLTGTDRFVGEVESIVDTNSEAAEARLGK